MYVYKNSKELQILMLGSSNFQGMHIMRVFVAREQYEMRAVYDPSRQLGALARDD